METFGDSDVVIRPPEQCATELLQCACSPELAALVTEKAKEMGVSRSELIRTALRTYCGTAGQDEGWPP